MRVVHLHAASEMVDWRAPWDDLVSGTGASVFQSWAWVHAWWQHLAPAARVTLLIDEDPTPNEDSSADHPFESLASNDHRGDSSQRQWNGLIALAHVRSRVHRSVPWEIGHLSIAGAGVGAADHLGPVARSEDSRHRLLRAAIDYAGDQPLLLPHLASINDGLLDGTRGVCSYESTPCPRVNVAELVLAEELWHPSRRGDVRRCLRRAEELGFEQSAFRVQRNAEARLTEVQHLHGALWNQRGTAGLFDDLRKEFLLCLADSFAEPDGLWLLRIGDGNRAIAGMVAIQHGATLSSYITGWDPDFQRLGLGVLLEAGGLQRTIDLGLGSYDFLRGTERHKLALGGRVTVDRSWCWPGSARGWGLLGREWVAARRGRRWLFDPDLLEQDGERGTDDRHRCP